MALPTNGRVIIDTTAGEIEIELWSKETPRTCRNFIALALEGYYDGVIFHRIIPGFLVQTGDKTGTGGGGESFYGVKRCGCPLIPHPNSVDIASTSRWKA
ncbi:cyclophilin-like domain-containing protein [Suillus variegatus]|nr:cyclophilin-like domain-containing protein [Suillus variegatus]